MEFLKNFNIKDAPIAKMLGVLFAGVVIIWLAIVLISAMFGSIGGVIDRGDYAYDSKSAPSFAELNVGYDDYEEGLSLRNIVSPTEPDYATGDAEAFEITEYYSTIRTRNLERDCSAVEALKAPEYIIFENSNRGERNCNYQFKVENAHADEVLAAIEKLKPESLNSNTHTIKMIVDDYTSESEILKNKLASVEETLEAAQNAYDELSELATETRDVETLAKIIDSKVNLIERLTTQRIDIKERIDRINRLKAEQLDRLEYTFFNVNIYEYLIVDGKQIKDSWIRELQQFVRNANKAVQDMSVGLVTFLLQVVQVALYLVVILLVVKFGWKAVRRLWKS